MSDATVRWTRATVYADMWVDPDDDPREVGASGTDERGILTDYLRRYRLTLQMKCADLDAEQLSRRSVPPSTMSLLGLVRHMAEVERSWFRRVMAGQDAASLYSTADSPGQDWDGAIADEGLVAEAWQAWGEEVGVRGAVRRGDHGSRGVRKDAERAQCALARHPRAHDRGIRAPLRAGRPPAGVHRRTSRPVAPQRDSTAPLHQPNRRGAAIDRRACPPVIDRLSDRLRGPLLRHPCDGYKRQRLPSAERWKRRQLPGLYQRVPRPVTRSEPPDLLLPPVMGPAVSA